MTSEFSRSFTTNSLGLCDSEHPLHSDSICRIICLGDSYTEGIGSTGDSSYPELLQKELPHSEVMRCGISGSDPLFDYMLLTEKLLNYHPNVVTIAINSSDIDDVIARGSFTRFLSDGKVEYNQGPLWEPLFGASHLVRLGVRNIWKKDFLFLNAKQRAIEETKAITILQHCMDSFYINCNKNGIHPVFIFHPNGGEIGTGYPKIQPLIQYAKDREYDYADVLAAFRNNGVTSANARQYYWALDGHNKNNAYAIFAKAITQHILISNP